MGDSRLLSTRTLSSGDCLRSEDGKSKLEMQSGGNLVLSREGRVLWSSGTDGHPGAHAVMEATGQLVVYINPRDTTVLWRSNSLSVPGASLQLLDDSNLVISSDTQIVWESNSCLHILQPGSTMKSGDSIYSQDKESKLEMRTDGNLVLSNQGKDVWKTGTSHQGTHAVMESNGQLVLYDGATSVWRTNSQGLVGAFLKIQNNGDLGIYFGEDLMLTRERLFQMPSPRLRMGDEAFGILDSSNRNVLAPGSRLDPGQRLISEDKQSELVMQSSGMLALYNNGQELWSRGNLGRQGAYAVMQRDGNLVVCRDSTPLWNTGIQGKLGSFLQLQNDSNLVIYYGNKPMWESESGLSVLHPGSKMLPGYTLYSPHKESKLEMEKGGNLVLSRKGSELWRIPRNSEGGQAVMELTGNFVMGEGWSTQTQGLIGAFLRIQDTGDLELFFGEEVVLRVKRPDQLFSARNARLGDEAFGVLDSNNRNVLAPGSRLESGRKLTSADNQSELVMESTGQLTLYNNGQELWNSGTHGHHGACAVMQLDGNLIIYQEPDKLWSTGIQGKIGSFLQLQNDRNLVIYYGNKALWESKTSPNTLSPGRKMLPGYSLYSKNKESKLSMGLNGNLIVSRNGDELWSSGKHSRDGIYPIFESDGNLAIYEGPTAISSVITPKVTRPSLELRNDGNLVIYAGKRILWESKRGLMRQESEVESVTSPTKRPRVIQPEHVVDSGLDALEGLNTLEPGRFLISQDGLNKLVMEGGNLVIYKKEEQYWTSEDLTHHQGEYATMQGGNFAVYGKGEVIWSVETQSIGARMTLLNDSNLVIDCKETRLWSLVEMLKSTRQLHGPNL